MKAWYQNGPGEDIIFGEIAQPVIGPDSVALAVEAVSVNPVDWKTLWGKRRTASEVVYPLVPGRDVVGTVVDMGPGVTDFSVGQRLIGYSRPDILKNGTFCEIATVPERCLVPATDSLSIHEWAGLPLAGLTAYQGLRALGLKEGRTVLILGGSGGVGTLAIQIAKAQGLTVYATCSKKNTDLVESLGARPIDYHGDAIDRLETPIDGILDLVGHGEFHRASAPRVVSVVDPDVVPGGGIFSYAKPNRSDLKALVDMVDAGQLTPVISEVFPFEEADEALERSQDGHAVGKLVITIKEEL